MVISPTHRTGTSTTASSGSIRTGSTMRIRTTVPLRVPLRYVTLFKKEPSCMGSFLYGSFPSPKHASDFLCLFLKWKMLFFCEASRIISKTQKNFDEFKANACLFNMAGFPFFFRISRFYNSAYKSKNSFFGFFSQRISIALWIFLFRCSQMKFNRDPSHGKMVVFKEGWKQ